jgi:hypothetical protein
MARIAMSPSEVMYASMVGLARHEQMRFCDDKPYYNRDYMEPDVHAQPAAVLCEMAVAKFLNIYHLPTCWNVTEHKQHNLDADIEDIIEVRRVRKVNIEKGNGPGVRLKDIGKTIVACGVSGEMDEVDILGWLEITERHRGYIKSQESERGFCSAKIESLRPCDDDFVTHMLSLIEQKKSAAVA